MNKSSKNQRIYEIINRYNKKLVDIILLKIGDNIIITTKTIVQKYGTVKTHKINCFYNEDTHEIEKEHIILITNIDGIEVKIIDKMEEEIYLLE